MKVILGLGNPGREYEATRHNVGWWVLDHLADVWHFNGWKKDGEALVSTATVGGSKVRLIKPLTYMNLSGSVMKNYLRRPFWAPQKDLLVIVDEVQIEVGRYRLRARGSAGPDNGRCEQRRCSETTIELHIARPFWISVEKSRQRQRPRSPSSFGHL